jgi:VanZ family protein
MPSAKAPGLDAEGRGIKPATLARPTGSKRLRRRGTIAAPPLIQEREVKIFLWWLLVVLWMGVIFALSAIPSLAFSLAPRYDFILRKGAHLAEYAVLTMLLARAFCWHLPSLTPAYLLAVLVAGGYALSDEWHQTFVSGRVGSLRDVGIDTLGILGAWALAYRGQVTTASRRTEA